MVVDAVVPPCVDDAMHACACGRGDAVFVVVVVMATVAHRIPRQRTIKGMSRLRGGGGGRQQPCQLPSLNLLEVKERVGPVRCQSIVIVIMSHSVAFDVDVIIL